MNLERYALWQPKAGNALDEYEDAFVLPRRARNGKPFVCAIADGATESLLSRQWAQVLTRQFARQWLAARDWRGWWNETLRVWQNEKRAYMERRARADKPVQWYEEPGLEAGAFAALLGLVLMPTPHALTWRAAAVGDCCLVQVRDDKLLAAFPMQDAHAFNNRPYLLSSNPARNIALAEQWRFVEGNFATGDRLYVMTDALAAWFLRASEAGAQPWAEVDAHRNADAFAAWLAELRAARAIRNDDVTLIRLQYRG